MSNRTEVTAQVESAVNQVAEAFSGEARVVETERGIVVEDDEGMYIITEGDGESDNATSGGDDRTPTESEDTSEAGDEDEPTIEDGEVACRCGAVFDSRQSLNGHLAHCDAQPKAEQDNEEGEDTSEAGEEVSISDAELVEAGVKESNIEDVRKYRSKNGVCSEENCPYGANDESEYCASHQSSTDDEDSNESNSTSSKGYEDLTEGQKAAARDLISDENLSPEEAVEMV